MDDFLEEGTHRVLALDDQRSANEVLGITLEIEVVGVGLKHSLYVTDAESTVGFFSDGSRGLVVQHCNAFRALGNVKYDPVPGFPI